MGGTTGTSSAHAPSIVGWLAYPTGQGCSGIHWPSIQDSLAGQLGHPGQLAPHSMGFIGVQAFIAGVVPTAPQFVIPSPSVSLHWAAGSAPVVQEPIVTAGSQ